MEMKKYDSLMRQSLYILMLVLVGAPLWTRAQGELDETETVYYNDEKTFGIGLATLGWEMNYRQGRRVDATHKNLWGASMGWIHHPKQHSEQSPYVPGLMIDYGRLNYTTNFRFYVGRMH